MNIPRLEYANEPTDLANSSARSPPIAAAYPGTAAPSESVVPPEHLALLGPGTALRHVPGIQTPFLIHAKRFCPIVSVDNATLFHRTSLVPLHSGYFEHPQNCFPALAPRFAVRFTMSALHVGQSGAGEMSNACV